MQILISCAKDMSSKEEVKKNYGVDDVVMDDWPATRPLCWDEAVLAAGEMAGKSAAEISKLLKCSEDIGELNQLRYEHFSEFAGMTRQDFTKGGISADFLQAAMAYSGIAFKHLRAAEWGPEEMEFANGHLWIMSFLYGLLRPMDLILPYRMEGNVKLKVHQGKSMFDWWKPTLTETLIQAVREDDGTLLWCSTEEMKRMVDWNRVCREVKVIEPDFLVHKGGKLKSMSVYAKMCRGALSRQVIQRRGELAPEELEHFVYENFHFEEAQTTSDPTLNYTKLLFIKEM